ncbi:general substrate transporter [Pterulicium gracile]|uniref:Quinate transporter n=1 Tax=Pterulicium gracile TaxID=1884261 RepID=A0A5C3QGN7_9AGAR|nr:general substrate transporter [Pterula gracilis]
MGLFSKVEDRPTPPEVYGWRIYASALTAAFGAMIFGYDSGFIGGTIALPSFGNTFFDGGRSAQRPNESANIVSTYQAGAIAGALLAYPISDRWGRKAGIVFAGVTNIIGAILQLCATSSTGLGIFLAGRVIGGMGVGAVSMVVPIYIAEISPTSIRGRLVGFYELLLQIGGVVGFWIPFAVNLNIPETDAKQWHIPVALQLIPAGLLILGALYLPESPRWLLKKNRPEHALKNLMYLRNLPADHHYVQEEVDIINRAIALETGASKRAGRWPKVREVMLKGNRNRLGMGCALLAFQNLTGVNAINYYSPTIFQALGVRGTSNSLFSTGVYGVVKMVCTLVFCLWIVDNFGRRFVFIVGAAGGAISMFYIGAYVKIAEPSADKDLGQGGVSAIAMIYVFSVFYAVSWNGLPWVYASEIYPVSIRGLCMSITAATQWVFQFAIARATPYMLRDMGYGTYMFFGSWMVVMIGWVWLFLKETKGVSLEDMDKLFGLTAYRHSSAPEESQPESRDESQPRQSSLEKTSPAGDRVRQV